LLNTTRKKKTRMLPKGPDAITPCRKRYRERITGGNSAILALGRREEEGGRQIEGGKRRREGEI
jgi:hypothetical protein